MVVMMAGIFLIGSLVYGLRMSMIRNKTHKTLREKMVLAVSPEKRVRNVAAGQSQ
jgi:hypothetical protein